METQEAERMEHSTALVESAKPLGQLARKDYAREQIELIKATVAVDATDAELDLFLELASRYQLDPFAGHIWCAKMRGENAQGGKMVVLIGRDGMLVLARRHADFKGLRGNIVHENDEFAVEETEDDIKVTHKIGKPTDRGEIVGAWAKVIRDGQHPTYFFAPLSEYLPTHSKVDSTPWGKQRSAMILKCAQSTALRFAFSITGMVGAEEISTQLSDPHRAEMDAAAGNIEWGEDEQIKAHLAELFAVANATVVDSYRPRKIQAMLAGKTEGERRQIILDLEKFIEDNGGKVPDPPPLDNTKDSVEEEEAEDADWEPKDEQAVAEQTVEQTPEEEAAERVVEEGRAEGEADDSDIAFGTDEEIEREQGKLIE